MADILHQVPIAAEPHAVFKAITDQAGLACWWTEAVEAEEEVGAVARFSFEGGDVVMLMEITKLEEAERVEWQVLDPAPPEWKGTSVTWELAPTDEGTRLLFGHRHWQSTAGSFAAINYNWAYYLTSLKQYLETGKGFPHTS
jgi:uncharacterized protein YndB with AHSA1/START domain